MEEREKRTWLLHQMVDQVGQSERILAHQLPLSSPISFDLLLSLVLANTTENMALFLCLCLIILFYFI